MNTKQVTKEEFYAVMGPLNVHPTIVNDWDEIIGYRSEWKMLDTRKIMGFSWGKEPPYTYELVIS